jgi:hypothetical protein
MEKERSRLRRIAQTITATVSIALIATACDASKASKTATDSKAPEAYSRTRAEKYRRNPNPKQRYDITMAIADAPGPFESVQWYANYEAPNCLFILDRFAGVTSRPSYRMPVHFRKVDGSIYVGTVHLDAMLDEDYFGDGVCHWELRGTSVSLKATGSKGETDFLPGMQLNEVLAGESKSTYFWRGRYPRSTANDFPDFGEPNIDEFRPGIRDNLFTITFSSKEVQP